MSEEKEKKKAPVYKSRVGSIEANVWEQEGDNGNFFTISFQRNYKDKSDDTWKSTQSLRVNDIQDVKMALSDCHRYCKQLSKKKESEDDK